LLDEEDLKTKGGPIPSALREILRLDKYQEGAIGYLSFDAYKDARINEHGTYIWDHTSKPSAVQGSGVTLGERIALQQQSQAKLGERKSESKIFKKGDSNSR